MAGGKETPRQKMIGMMYLVLTALLALNVSKQILKGFVTVDENIEKSKLILDENNLKIKQAFEEYVNKGNFEAKPYLLKSIEAQKSIRVVDAYIDSMKMLVVHKTENGNLKDTAQLRFMEKLDDYDTPTFWLIGSDEANPITTKYSAKDLKTQLSNLHNHLITMIDNMQKNADTKLEVDDLNALKQKLQSIKPIDRNIMDDGIKQNWELENFYHLPMAAVITNLNKIQADMKNIESEFLHVFSAASGKFEIKTKKLEAKVIAPTAYVLSGQAFKADVVLGASFNELGSDKMQVLVGAQYDSVSKKVFGNDNPLNVSNGIAKYEIATSAIGQKELKGLVVYKNPRGVNEYYPFNYTYMVAPPFTAVAADNMNIFYVGVDNPVSVSSAGFAPSQLQVTVSGCGASVKPNNNGSYILQAKSTGTCLVTVLAKTDKGFKPQGPPKVFRVKGIPPPVVKIGGKLATSNLEFTKGEIQAMSGLAAESPGFMFPVTMVVKSFDVEIKTGGEIKTIQCSSNVLNAEAKRALSNLRPNQKVYIDNVKVQTPTGTIGLPMAQFKMKG